MSEEALTKMYQAKNPKLLRKCSVILCSIGLAVVHIHLLQRQKVSVLSFKKVLKSRFRAKTEETNMNPYVLIIIHSIGIGQNISVLIGHYLGWEFFFLQNIKTHENPYLIFRFPCFTASMDSIWLHLPSDRFLESAPIRHKKRPPSHILELLESSIRDQTLSNIKILNH